MVGRLTGSSRRLIFLIRLIHSDLHTVVVVICQVCVVLEECSIPRKAVIEDVASRAHIRGLGMCIRELICVGPSQNSGDFINNNSRSEVEEIDILKSEGLLYVQ